MERVEELLLNFALNYAAGSFRPPVSRSERRPRAPYPPPSEAPSYAFVTDGYFAFVQWLRQARVVLVRPELPVDFHFLQHRLTQRQVQVETLAQDQETGALLWPRDLPRQLVGIFSDPNVVRSLPGRHAVTALLPTTSAVLQEVRSWRVSWMKRLDLMWVQHTRFRDFMRRNLERTGVKEALTPEHFQFMSRWMLVEVHVMQQKEEGWYWPLPVFPLPPPPPQPPLPLADRQPLPWVMPDQPLPPALYASFVIAAAAAAPVDPSNTPAETRAQTTIPPGSPTQHQPTSPPPREYHPTSPPPGARSFSFSE